MCKLITRNWCIVHIVMIKGVMIILVYDRVLNGH